MRRLIVKKDKKVDKRPFIVESVVGNKSNPKFIFKLLKIKERPNNQKDFVYKDTNISYLSQKDYPHST